MPHNERIYNKLPPHHDQAGLTHAKEFTSSDEFRASQENSVALSVFFLFSQEKIVAS